MLIPAPYSADLVLEQTLVDNELIFIPPQMIHCDLLLDLVVDYTIATGNKAWGYCCNRILYGISYSLYSSTHTEKV